MKTRVIAVANQKGGVGKTTTTINLSACLVERRKKVLLIDLDPQANATSGMGFDKEPGGSIYPVMLEGGNLRDQIKPTDYRNFDLITAEIDLAGAEVDIVRDEGYLHRIKRVLDPVVEAGLYDFIMLDCPPSLGILTVNALTAAHGVLIPLQCEYYALEGLSTITDILRQLRANGTNPGLEIEGIVMTMFDGRTNLAQQVVEEVMTHFGDKLYQALIPRNIRLSEAPSFGKPVIVHDPRCTGSAAYRLLAREFLKRRAEAEAAEVVAGDARTVRIELPAPPEIPAASAGAQPAPSAEGEPDAAPGPAAGD